jgi:hypothetical protein
VYVAVILCTPAVENDLVNVAVPLAAVKFAAFCAEAFAGTIVAVPSVVPPAEKVTVPVGPTPTLCVPIVAVSVTFCPIDTAFALEARLIEVGPFVMVTTVAADVLVL